MSECRNCGAPLSPAAHACHYCAAPGPNAGPVMGAGTAIELQAVGRNKIVVIKVVFTHALGVRGLKEAKDLVERPMPVRISVDPTRAGAALDAFTQAGARARIVGLRSAARARIVGLTPASRPRRPPPSAPTLKPRRFRADGRVARRRRANPPG
ncbi:MAG TPA: ribosomal protein L7/L12 [Polyangiaceae bacterium]|nr:ribosomal protein L7/L12 [Polyangiaceae bacterium]